MDNEGAPGTVEAPSLLTTGRVEVLYTITFATTPRHLRRPVEQRS
jgi:hypothetical protein